MSADLVTFRKLIDKDWEAVSQIYLEGIETGNATFEGAVPTWDDWDKNHLSNCRLVAEIDNKVVGWCALSPISSRKVYQGVAEISVYISSNFYGKKIGSTLLNKLIVESEANNIWTLQASIFRENIASLRIHKKLGFRKVGYREKIGFMHGKWRDTILVERRSKIIAVN